MLPPTHPCWRSPPTKPRQNGDLAYFDSLYPGNLPELMKLLYDTHAGMTQAEFEAQAYAFLCQAIHPRYGRPFMQLGYQPMIELIRYLEANGFKVFIASAGGMSFMRTVSEEIYGIPREQVIGSNIAYETRMTDDGPVIFRKPGLVEPISDGPGKPVNIELHIGRKPILAGGNADGDLHMLWYSQTSPYQIAPIAPAPRRWRAGIRLRCRRREGAAAGRHAQLAGDQHAAGFSQVFAFE